VLLTLRPFATIVRVFGRDFPATENEIQEGRTVVTDQGPKRIWLRPGGHPKDHERPKERNKGDDDLQNLQDNGVVTADYPNGNDKRECERHAQGNSQNAQFCPRLDESIFTDSEL
jgi:hypothetical protein